MTKRAEILDDVSHSSPSFDAGQNSKNFKIAGEGPDARGDRGILIDFRFLEFFFCCCCERAGARRGFLEFFFCCCCARFGILPRFLEYKNSKNLRGARGKNHAQTSHSLARRIPRTSRIWSGKNPHVKTVFCMSVRRGAKSAESGSGGGCWNGTRRALAHAASARHTAPTRISCGAHVASRHVAKSSAGGAKRPRRSAGMAVVRLCTSGLHGHPRSRARTLRALSGGLSGARRDERRGVERGGVRPPRARI